MENKTIELSAEKILYILGWTFGILGSLGSLIYATNFPDPYAFYIFIGGMLLSALNGAFLICISKIIVLLTSINQKMGGADHTLKNEVSFSTAPTMATSSHNLQKNTPSMLDDDDAIQKIKNRLHELGESTHE